jgi:hypothetical protein
LGGATAGVSDTGVSMGEVTGVLERYSEDAHPRLPSRFTRI